MLMDIKTVDLNLSRHPEPYCLVNDLKYNEHYNKHICRHRDNAERLNAELSDSAAVEQSCRNTVTAVAEKSHCKSTPDSVDHMHGNRAHRVIDLRHIVEEFYGLHHQEACDKSDEESAHRCDTVAGRCDRHQTCQSRVECDRDIRLSIAHPCEDHAHNRRHSCSKVRVKHDQRRQFHICIRRHGNSRTSVEPEPAEPEYENSQSHCRDIMSRDRSCLSVLVIFADTGAKHCRAEAGDQASYHMYAG